MKYRVFAHDGYDQFDTDTLYGIQSDDIKVCIGDLLSHVKNTSNRVNDSEYLIVFDGKIKVIVNTYTEREIFHVKLLYIERLCSQTYKLVEIEQTWEQM